MIQTKSATAVDPLHLKAKKHDFILTKKTIVLLSAFKNSAQFIKSCLKYRRFQGLMN